MNDERKSDTDSRIRELEAQVAALSRELQEARKDRRTSSVRGRRIGDSLPKPPPPTGRAWVIRSLLVMLVTAVGVATANTYALQDFDRWSVSSLGRGPAGLPVDYTLLACGAAALVAVILYRKRAQAFLFVALSAFYVTFAFYLFNPLAILSLEQRTYAWLAFGALTGWHILASILCVMESRRFGRGRRRAAFLATLNCLAYYPILWHGLHVYGSTRIGFVYAALAVVALSLAAYAESSGPHRNYLFQVFLGAALLLANFALHRTLHGPWFLAAMTLECLLLAVLYHATGIILLKIANLVVLVITFVVTMQAMKFADTVQVGDRVVQSNWVQGVFSASILMLTSWYYAHYVRGVKPQHRKISGHWFLADSPADVPPLTVSLLHAASAALLLMLLVISDLGNLPTLPFILAAFSLAVAALGYFVRAPQIEVGAVMLVIAAHVSFYFFLWTDKAGFVDQERFELFTLLLTAYTYFGGYRGERFLERISAGRSHDYHASAAIPYIIATGSTAALVYRYVGGGHTPIALAGIAIALASIGVAMRSTGLRISAASALGIAAGVWGYFLVRLESPLVDSPWMWPMLIGIMAACILVERSLLVHRRGELIAGTLEHIVQVLLLLLAGGIGAMTISYSGGDWRTTLLFVHALIWIALCMALADYHYCWTALLVLLGSTTWLGYGQMKSRTNLIVPVVCAVILLLLLGAAWVFVFRKQQAQPPGRLAPGK